ETPRAAAARAAIWGIGAQTTTSSASRQASSSEPAASKPPCAPARAVVSGSASHPTTRQPARTAAMAIDVPIKPVPSTATRRRKAGSAEVIAKRLRAVEVDVRDVLHAELGMEVHQDPH